MNAPGGGLHGVKEQLIARAMTKPDRARPHKGGHAGKRAPLLLYGRHPVLAALANPRRRCLKLFASARGLATLDPRVLDALPAIETCEQRALDRMVGDVPHQGLVLAVAPLASPDLAALIPPREAPSLILMLDRVEDPHNVGAILRSAAAFGADLVIGQDRHSPPETGALARAASGALDIVPWVRTANLSATLEMLAEHGYWSIGLDGSAQKRIGELDLGQRLVLVLGAEGHGLRPLVARHCDMRARIALRGRSPLLDSLNVSNAAAVALHALTAARG
ncbi:MAG: hypothetical protein Tsb008_22980 [Rhodothalassiaceae bacterium]